jgi:argininosuccinate synthase
MVTALRALEELVLDKECRKWKNTFANEFAHLVYDGRWFTPLKDSILASAEALAEVFTGEIIVKLYKGNVTAVQKKSPNSLYNEDFATFGADDVYNQSHAEGFIRLFSLSSRITALSKENTK